MMLAPLLFFKCFSFLNKEGKSSRHYMLAFPLLWVVISAYSYLSMKDKYNTFYVSSSFIFTTLQFTDTKESEVESIADIIFYLFTV